jgi:hypothetical protein
VNGVKVKRITFAPLLARTYIIGRDYYNFEVIKMDLFWSGLARRAAEHTRVERRSQFSKVHEIAIREIELKNHVDAT